MFLLKIPFSQLKSQCRQLFAASPLLALLSGCVALAPETTDVKKDGGVHSFVSEQAVVNTKNAVSDDLPPNLELDQDLLTQLLISNFASYSADWPLAADATFSAAEQSKDYRLARLAAVLSLRAKQYPQAAQAAELWAELQVLDKAQHSDAKLTLLLAQLGAGDVDAAYLNLEQRRAVISEGVQNGTQLKDTAGIKSAANEKEINQHIKDVGGILVRQTNADAAIDLAKRYIEEHPSSAQVALSMAYVASNFKRSILAEQWLEQALVLRPNWDLAAQMKVNMLEAQNKPQERTNYIQAFIADNPSSISMRISQASDFAKQQQYAPALSVMQAVLKDQAKKKSIPRSNGRGDSQSDAGAEIIEKVSSLIFSAALAQQLDKAGLAQDYYQRVLKLNPKHDEALWGIAAQAVRQKNYQRAEKYYQKIQSETGYFQAQLQLANMRYFTDGLDQALAVLDELEAKTQEQYIDWANTKHYLLLRDNRYEEAFAAINEALAYLPENSELKYARALVAAELNQLPTVEADLRSIIAKQPNHANALNALGYTLADQTERFAEAKALIERALELRPDDAHILDSMGWVLYRLTDYEQAIEYLQRAYAKAPEVEVAAHLGEVLWHKGDTDKAKQVWQDAFNQDASNLLLNETLDRYGIKFETP